MKVAFYTLGCKLNQCESEALARAFQSRGFFIVSLDGHPDLVIVNTCTVTSKAEQKARRVLKKTAADYPQAVIIVTGCYAQMARTEIEALLPSLFVVPSEKKADLLDLPQFLLTDSYAGERLSESVVRFFSEHPQREKDPFAFESVPGLYHIRSFVKIQDGCDNACRYCRVTLARGSSVSLPVCEVERRVASAEAAGATEIVLSGVNLSQYRDGNIDLSGLIARLAPQLKNARLRLSSIEPDFVDDAFAAAVAHPNVCPHFHLALQSGSTTVLDRMGRHYDARRAAEAIRLLRTAKEDPFLAADVITGFDGETDEEFGETKRFVTENRLHALHVFPFSPRPGTAAAHPKHPVPERIRDERAAVLRECLQPHLAAYREKWGRRPADVIIEEVMSLGDGRYRYEALSDRYLHFRFESDKKLKKGERIGNFFTASLDFFS